ncbi:MAG TPA: hypothetical protein VMZ26_03210 [Pyrinomonadaceae bacterium]|nr:hypothetical protein [Pyrinomonadaceae bacterium]
MKRCPECHKDYFDESLVFCLDDGARLPSQSGDVADAATAILPSDAISSDVPTRRITSADEVHRFGGSKLFAGAVVALIALGAIAYFALSGKRSQNIEQSVVRFPITIPEKNWFSPDVEQHNAVISPDGRKVVFTLWSQGKSVLYLRNLDQVEVRPIAGTDKAYSPFWAPDSQSVAFFADGKLRRVDTNGGGVQTICDVSEQDTAATWGSTGTIVFLVAPQESALAQVSAAGGVPSEAYKPRDLSVDWPYFLPDGRHFIFFGRGRKSSSQTLPEGIYAGTLGSNDAKLVLETPATRVEYAEPGYILFVREGSLLAQHFDLSSLAVSGEPGVVAENVNYFDKTGYSEWSVSQTGVLVLPSQLSLSRLLWLDRNGRELGRIGEQDLFTEMRLSPEGTKIAVTIVDPQTTSGNIWLYDLNGLRSRFVFGPRDEAGGVWSPDGRRIAYFKNGGSTIRIKDVSDVAGEGETPIPEGFIGVSDWSRDGKYIIYTLNDPTVQRDIWILPMTGDGKPFPFIKTQSNEFGARFSPDTRYVAFASDESGTQEIYAAPFSNPTQKVRISPAGGSSPRWSPDGRELFYLAGNGPLTGVSFTDGKVGTPVPLFDGTSIADFDVSADGKKFLVISWVPSVVSAPLNVMLNWTAALKK